MLSRTMQKGWNALADKIGIVLTETEINAIQTILSKGYRVELIPIKDGKVHLIKVKREEIQASHP